MAEEFKNRASKIHADAIAEIDQAKTTDVLHELKGYLGQRGLPKAKLEEADNFYEIIEILMR